DALARGRVADAKDLHEEADRLHDHLQTLVTQLRMIPIGPTFKRHARTVRDLAETSGKKARLVVEGGDVEVDMAVVEHLHDRLVLEPGFSTADTVTALSGRGVGMDVVRSNVEALRGSLSLQSAEGAGTTITVRLPLTLAIIDGFGVGAGDESYVIPLDAVVEC